MSASEERIIHRGAVAHAMREPSFSPGDRVELIQMGNDPDPIAPGTRGWVTNCVVLSGWEQVSVVWDNGRRLMVVLPEDKIRRVTDAQQ